MQTELRQFINQARFYRGSVQQVAGMLPQDDVELDALIAEIVAENDQYAFIYVVMGALSRDRRVDAKHLKFGAMLFPYHQWLGCVALRMQGDVAENLLAAIQNTKLVPRMEAVSLFLAATWCQKHREGVLPIGLIATARLRARRQKLDSDITPFLLMLALEAKDAGLNAIIRKNVPNASDQEWKDVEESSLNLAAQWREIWRRPILESINESPGNQLARGSTMRRAVARLGRNEPCHCGSGKKYKNCCLEKDHERLHHSSDVAGRTREELHADPERYLTAARMNKTGAHELARFDPTKIPEPLQKTYLRRLCGFNLLDRLVEAFEKTGYSDEKLFSWENATLFITRAGRKDLLLRMINLRPNPAEVEKQIFIGSALLLKEDNPAEVLSIIEECSVDAVKSEAPDDIFGFSYGLLYSKFPALGILAARGAIPIVSEKEASTLFEEILKARDKLNLPPDDPFSDVIDKHVANHEDGEKKESAGLRNAREKLNDKAQEVRQLKESLAQLQKEIIRREEKRASAIINTPSITPAPADESALKELRKKVEMLQSTLKERHHERNDLRRALQKTSAELETLRENPTIAAPKESETLDREEELLLPQDAPEVHPVRLIDFPKGFYQTLAGLPRHVARATMIMIGRLAAGEPAAFVGALRLKAVPNVMRQRIGSDFRLLFRLAPDHLQVIDLINRKDLDRRLKTL